MFYYFAKESVCQRVRRSYVLFSDYPCLPSWLCDQAWSYVCTLQLLCVIPALGYCSCDVLFLGGAGLLNSPKTRAVDIAILCGGKGSRLWPVVSDRPKSMAVLRGRPFLEWQLLALQERGFSHVVLCTGYMGERIRRYFGDGDRVGLQISYSEESEARGTGGALKNALSCIHTSSVLVLNGDSWCDVDLQQLIQFHETHEAKGTLTLTTVAHPQRYGQVGLGDNEEIVRFFEKGQRILNGWINAGMYVLSHEFLDEIPHQTNVSLEYDVFPNWVEKGLYGYRGTHRFFDIGTPTSYTQAEQEFENVFRTIANQQSSVTSAR